eukprot:RCo013424
MPAHQPMPNSPGSPKMEAVRLDTSLVNPVVWSEIYLVGVPLIDTQHRKLFTLVESLRLAFVLHKADTVVMKTLKGVLSYCAEHFESEELLMQVVGYPSFASHVAQHRQFTATAQGYAERFERGELVPEELFKGLLDWLVTHVMTVDPTIAEYCSKSGVDTASIVTVSDLVKVLEKNQNSPKTCVKPELGLALLVLPALVLFCVFAFWDAAQNPLRSGLAAAAAIGILATDLGVV